MKTFLNGLNTNSCEHYCPLVFLVTKLLFNNREYKPTKETVAGFYTSSFQLV